MTFEQKQTADNVEQDINLLELLHVVIKRKMMIVKVCTIALALSAGYSLTLPNIYTANSKVIPPQKDSGGGGLAMLGQMGGLASLASGVKGNDIEQYLSILRSRSVEGAVVERLGLTKVYGVRSAGDARERLDGALKSMAGKDGIINISVNDKDPKLAALLANTLAEELGKTALNLNLTKAGSERVFLGKRLELAKTELKTAEENMKSFAQQNKLVQVDSQAKVSLEGIGRIKSEIASKEVQLAILSSNQTAQSPNVLALQTGLKRLKQELATLTGNERSGAAIPSIGNVPGLGLEFARRYRDLKTKEAIFEQLTKQYEVAKLNEAKDSSAFQVLDVAVVPERKSKPMRSLIVAFSTGLAFVFAVLAAFVLEYLEKMSSEDRALLHAIKQRALSIK